MSHQENLQKLKLKQARLFSEIEMLSEVSPLMYQNFGKVTADIMKLEKQITRETKNQFDGN